MKAPLLVSTTLMLSCAAIACEPSGQAATSVTVCEVKEDPQHFEGKDVIFSALYRSDRRHFSLLTDEHCGAERNTVQVGANDSQSAKDLWEKWEGICLERGDQGYCVVSERVVVHGRVRLGDDGVFVDVKSIQEEDGSFTP